ncbi:type I secretion outer membrane protein, TolC family [Chryseobacterium gleum]|uniref:Type I secretion outer membrane protein, TolC family n=2 Tax=Chryseobacterium gleum TaxID=250 RepID=A0A3S4MRL0_CHRGE|nr:TolC family protein [Chryseobacterium gleum]EFK37692.1 outer membrane efflux protein [Chryseobacterium gleum ATCC 35910]QQY32828.1 TolC family protein [Chryseobacterium gleum]VEE09932.1 type I secretion outer membrane protein, TolC family [Chryseobacterium gleum]
MLSRIFILALSSVFLVNTAKAQKVLTLQSALETAVHNYGTIKAKESYRLSSQESIELAKRQYLPNLNISLQQDYGTVNGQNGPLYGFGGYGVASSGLPLPDQNWNASFGALYLANVNWEFFAFGKARQRVKVAETKNQRDAKDLSDEIFQHKIKVTAAYLNVLAAKKLKLSYARNLGRTDTIRRIVEVKEKNGLVPGVDLSLAKADYANAMITYTKAKDNEQEQENKLAQLLGIPAQEFVLDSTLLKRIPAGFPTEKSSSLDSHPLLALYKSRIDVSEQEKQFLKTQYYPSFSMVGIFQTRGSGFGSNYAQNQNDYSSSYWDGVHPTRSNYLFGIGVSWNFTQTYRLSKEISAQDYVSQGLKHEYDLAEQQLKAQLDLSDNKWQNALRIYDQVPVQLKSASDAYIQRSVLYKNGLTDLVDLSQAIYALVRAETDRDIAISNVWNALLLKAAAMGDFSVFENEL